MFAGCVPVGGVSEAVPDAAADGGGKQLGVDETLTTDATFP